MKISICAAAFAIICGVSVPALAQHQHHGGHTGGGQPAQAQSESTKAYEAASAEMHKLMAITYSGDADADFVRGMIPHHKGAIDAAKIVLQYGKSAEIRKLAEGIIAAQENEIAWMNNWLANNGN